MLPLSSPQPALTDVVTAHRYYATLKSDDRYRKRVTRFSNLSIASDKAVFKYRGVYPGTNMSHGNAKHSTRHYYVRTQPATMRKLRDAVKHVK